jgi:hypothetical protein
MRFLESLLRAGDLAASLHVSGDLAVSIRARGVIQICTHEPKPRYTS